MSLIVDTLTQNDGESDADFVIRIQTYINNQLYYYNTAGGPWPIPPSDPGKGAYLGYPPDAPTSDSVIWNPSYNSGSGGNMRIVTFTYDNIYYYKYIGVSPPFPPPPPFPTSGDLTMFGSGGTLSDTGFFVDSGSSTVDWNSYRHVNAADGVNPQDLVTFNQIGGGAIIPSALTEIDDTNIILTLGGTPATALLQAVSITAGWTGQLSIARGGTGQTTANDAINALLPSQIGNVGKRLATDGINTSWVVDGGGTVTSVGLALPSELTVTISPITTSGTLTAVWADQSPNLIFAGPVGLPAAIPSFRSLVAADIPSTAVTAGSYGSATQVGTFTVDAAGRLTAASNITITPAASSITGGAALTKTDDTNVTLTLGGTPSSSLLAATSLTLGWTGQLGAARGGLGLDTSASTGFPEVSSGVWSIKTASQMRTDLGLVIGTNVEAWNANLDSWAAITRASGFDTFASSPSSANLRALLSDTSYNLLTESAEQSSTPISDNSENAATIANVRCYTFFTVPSTYKYIIITGIEWKNGTAVAGNVTAGVDIVDTNPPTLNASVMVALCQTVAQSGTNAVQRVSVVSSRPIEAGAIIGAWFYTDNIGKFRRLDSQPSMNFRKAITYTVAPPSQDATAWTSATLREYVKIYYKGYS